ncbi:hypothetical protein [Flavobacterium rhizosphaerae]|uniref:Uncharacterized protein n=1 Tax=Flavobacterium rhizosphaerae TaxID=3163298 RepID=A0ABW8YYJ4_9FLAO
MKVSMRIFILFIITLLYQNIWGVPVVWNREVSVPLHVTGNKFQDTNFHTNKQAALLPSSLFNTESAIPAVKQNPQPGKLPYSKACFSRYTASKLFKSTGCRYLAFCKSMSIRFARTDIIFPFHYFW